jgi:hypothetical protein
VLEDQDMRVIGTHERDVTATKSLPRILSVGSIVVEM